MMPRSFYLFTMGVTFTLGLLLGLLLHLPRASSPSSARHQRDTRALQATSRTLLQSNGRIPASDNISTQVLTRDSNLSPRFESRSNGGSLEETAVGIEHSAGDGVLTKTSNKLVTKLKDTNDGHVKGRNKAVTVLVDQRSASVNVRTRGSSHDKPLPHKDNEGEGFDTEYSNVRSASSDNILGGNLFEGIYWSPLAEALVPEGFTEPIGQDWRAKLGEARATGVVGGCGRMQNRLVMLDDGSKACARYRMNTDQILGEILSYHLSRILGIHNVPPSVLRLPNPQQRQWGLVSGEVAQAQWHPERPLILTPWIQQLKSVHIPMELRSDTERRFHPDLDLQQRSLDDIREVVQWSDLIVFDYLTGNLDRVVNNMYNLQWNAAMMESPTHNLEVTPSGLLVFLDNESGLLHSYRLLDKYQKYQRSLLKSVCVFRRSTVEAVKTLYRENNIGKVLRERFESDEPFHSLLPRLPDKNIKILHARLKEVHDQIEYCQNMYDSR